MSKRILVVDDDEAILDATHFLLEDYGYVVQTLSDGSLTCEAVAEFQPDLIFLDVLMSGVDGREVCQELKNSDNFKHIPVVMISAHPTARQDAIDNGADEFIAKPFESEQLISAINIHTN